MPYTAEGKHVMLNGPGLRPVISHMSVHSGKRAIAENELPVAVYQRRQVDLREPNDDVVMRSARKVEFDIPPGGHVESVGFWTAASGGSMVAWKPIPPKTFEFGGVLSVDLATFDLNLEEME